MIGVQLKGYRYQKAVVGFGGQPTLWWMRFLKKGFYHCIVALGNDEEWVVIDPLLHFTDMIMLKKTDVKKFFIKNNYRIVEVMLNEPKKIRLRVMPYTCVETAKRFLGVEKAWILTPYSLFRHLNKKIGKKSLTFD